MADNKPFQKIDTRRKASTDFLLPEQDVDNETLIARMKKTGLKDEIIERIVWHGPKAVDAYLEGTGVYINDDPEYRGKDFTSLRDYQLSVEKVMSGPAWKFARPPGWRPSTPKLQTSFPKNAIKLHVIAGLDFDPTDETNLIRLENFLDEHPVRQFTMIMEKTPAPDPDAKGEVLKDKKGNVIYDEPVINKFVKDFAAQHGIPVVEYDPAKMTIGKDDIARRNAAEQQMLYNADAFLEFPTLWKRYSVVNKIFTKPKPGSTDKDHSNKPYFTSTEFAQAPFARVMSTGALAGSIQNRLVEDLQDLLQTPMAQRDAMWWKRSERMLKAIGWTSRPKDNKAPLPNYPDSFSAVQALHAEMQLAQQQNWKVLPPAEVPKGRTILVVGGRQNLVWGEDFDNFARFCATMNVDKIITGNEKGADSIAAQVASALGLEVERRDWKNMRTGENQRHKLALEVDGMYAFDGGSTTADLKNVFYEEGRPVFTPKRLVERDKRQKAMDVYGEAVPLEETVISERKFDEKTAFKNREKKNLLNYYKPDFSRKKFGNIRKGTKSLDEFFGKDFANVLSGSLYNPPTEQELWDARLRAERTENYKRVFAPLLRDFEESPRSTWNVGDPHPDRPATTVGNVSTQYASDSNTVYVGRKNGGIWGNPFPMANSSTEERFISISRYYEWLMSNPDMILKARKELAGKHLVCHCAPLACHAEILAAVADGRDVKFAMQVIRRKTIEGDKKTEVRTRKVLTGLEEANARIRKTDAIFDAGIDLNAASNFLHKESLWPQEPRGDEPHFFSGNMREDSRFDPEGPRVAGKLNENTLEGLKRYKEFHDRFQTLNPTKKEEDRKKRIYNPKKPWHLPPMMQEIQQEEPKGLDLLGMVRDNLNLRHASDDEFRDVDAIASDREVHEAYLRLMGEELNLPEQTEVQPYEIASRMSPVESVEIAKPAQAPRVRYNESGFIYELASPMEDASPSVVQTGPKKIEDTSYVRKLTTLKKPTEIDRRNAATKAKIRERDLKYGNKLLLVGDGNHIPVDGSREANQLLEYIKLNRIDTVVTLGHNTKFNRWAHTFLEGREAFRQTRNPSAQAQPLQLVHLPYKTDENSKKLIQKLAVGNTRRIYTMQVDDNVHEILRNAEGIPHDHIPGFSHKMLLAGDRNSLNCVDGVERIVQIAREQGVTSILAKDAQNGMMSPLATEVARQLRVPLQGVPLGEGIHDIYNIQNGLEKMVDSVFVLAPPTKYPANREVALITEGLSSMGKKIFY